MSEILPILFRGMEKYDIPHELILKIIYEFGGIIHPNSLSIKNYNLNKKWIVGCSCLYINMNKYDPNSGLRQGQDFEVIKCDFCSLDVDFMWDGDEENNNLANIWDLNNGWNEDDEEHNVNLDMLEMIRCENCGYEWDGNAQCLCAHYYE